MTKIDLTSIKAVDVHCHPYIANEEPYSPEEYLRKLSLSVLPNMFKKAKEASSTKIFPGMNMYMQITIQRLARYFGCQPILEEVVARRNEEAKDFTAFTQNLFKNAKLEGMVVDFGYPTPPLSKDDYQRLTGVPIWEVYRIEPVMVRLRESHETFGAFIEAYREDLKEALNRKHVVGLKTIIAYRSGLEIGDKNEQMAKDQYEEFRLNDRARAKELRDYCLHVAMEECTNFNKVLHIHTGFGDGEVVLPKASPSFLIDLLRQEKYAETKVHLVHGGYPWMEEAAFITSILPNVYLDISLQNPFVGHGVERIISQVYELAPFDKVMYGSDAFTVPEMNWLGVLLFKECFERVLTDWIEKGYTDKDMAVEIAEHMMYKNFERVYSDYI
ncbi:amidohydrolase [Siminovitchia terrae]|uniref:Amidohydrolase n=1 Tax=Siminovitchia terrae TaxID=1914933 RepID=A0A429XB77_SIMTE|nr:amidohydrolase family protein [Siminovitchia terrae]RST60333.1 amidohydrolase [Siminovitchia terrae]